MSTSHSLSLPFNVKSWDEKTLHQLDPAPDAKITQAAVVYSVTPAADSQLTAPNMAVDYVMSNPEAGDAATAHFVGFVRLDAQWEGKEAALVLREMGTYTKAAGTSSELVVVEGSGRGPWAGAKGRGTAKAGHSGGMMELTLELAA